MKKLIRLTAAALSTIMLVGILAGCQTDTVDIHEPALMNDAQYDEDIIDLEQELVPLTATPPTKYTFPQPEATGKQVKKNDKSLIDYSNAADGYVMISAKSTKNLKVQIKGPSGTAYTYNLNKDNKFEVFPLSDGNGSYTIGVFEQVEGTKYSTINSATVKVTLNDAFAPFLRPNQYVNFDIDNKSITKAQDLVKNSKTTLDKVSAIYNFVISTLTYDKDRAKKVAAGELPGYLPDIDQVLSAKKGICFDYAALMTAMLRSQGIACKLVVGYAGESYHAWIDVYTEETGWINSLIQFDGKTWKLMDPTYASSSKENAEVMKYIGDGKNYSVKYLY